MAVPQAAQQKALPRRRRQGGDRGGHRGGQGGHCRRCGGGAGALRLPFQGVPDLHGQRLKELGGCRLGLAIQLEIGRAPMAEGEVMGPFHLSSHHKAMDLVPLPVLLGTCSSVLGLKDKRDVKKWHEIACGSQVLDGVPR